MRQALEATDYTRIGESSNPFSRALNLIRRRGLTRGTGLTDWIEGLLRGRAGAGADFSANWTGAFRSSAATSPTRASSSSPTTSRSTRTSKATRSRPDEFPIADAVRVSAGYPYFFPPLTLRDRTTKKDAVLVDGGVASAFPVFLFDRPAPRRPTWGFRLHAGMGRGETVAP